ncbi:MAG: hypothetical protein KME45_29250 [Stenomitos rutilans HA7619-LM2]|nr:hypothetical protein [Stenomitos rutilans HA7619-LM2]
MSTTLPSRFETATLFSIHLITELQLSEWLLSLQPFLHLPSQASLPVELHG